MSRFQISYLPMPNLHEDPAALKARTRPRRCNPELPGTIRGRTSNFSYDVYAESVFAANGSKA